MPLEGLDTKYIYYQKDSLTLLLGDTFNLLDKITPESIDCIFADPPYFLSDDGITCKSGKMVSVNKAKWDMKKMDIYDKIEYNNLWIKKCNKLLKPNGTIWITGTLHNIYSVGVSLEICGFKILNNITWQKTNPPPNLSCRYFTHSTETILWAKKNESKSKHYFNYDLMKEMNNNKQMKDVWSGSLTKPSEKKEGKHPTQKPLYVLEKILLSSTNENDIVLDPFNGSGTTGVMSKKINRKYIGIDNVNEYLELSIRRFESE